MRFGKVSRTSARTEGERIDKSPAGSNPEQTQLLASDVLNGGMVTSIHSHKIQDNQLTLAQGYRTRLDGLERRKGSSLLTPAKPNSNPILLYSSFKRNDQTIKVFRFTRNSVHLYSTGAWTAVTGVALNSSDTDKFQTIGILDRLFFANNGADVLQEINLAANTYAAAGNAKKYKYYTSIYNRIVGANLNDILAPNPIEIGWSGDLNPTEWNNSIDPSAGNNILLESSGGAGDFITGVFNADNTLIVPRENSIWVADLSPVATFPFLFRQAVPGIGAGIPYAISAVSGGIAWYDRRLNNVFYFNVGSRGLAGGENTVVGTGGLSKIGDAIKGELSTADINKVFSSYNPVENEYIIGFIQANTNVVPIWVYNFNTQDWTYDELVNITGIWTLDYTTSSVTIGDLVGTIGDLVGTIGGLSTVDAQITEFYGKNNGDILVEDRTLVQEGGVNFTGRLVSKDYKLPALDMYIAELHLIYMPVIGGSFTVSYSIDGGANYISYKTVNFTSSSLNNQILVKFKKHIKCRQFRWKIESTNGRCRFVEYEIHVFPGSISRGDS